LVAGERVELEHYVYLKITSDDAQINLGNRVFIGRGAELDISDRLTVGDDVLIAPGCFITDHQHRYDSGDRIAAQGCRSAPVVIGDDVWLGANSVILSGTRIESGAIVGAGAVVTRDIGTRMIVAGVPARVIGTRGQG
jgi:acetyltransferase-like isoleucine patch superfamily enzyme